MQDECVSPLPQFSKSYKGKFRFIAQTKTSPVGEVSRQSRDGGVCRMSNNPSVACGDSSPTGELLDR